MTLKQKFGKLFLKGHNTADFEKIAEDFAVGFGIWLCKNEEVKELLEIYKKEKGL